MDILKFWNFHFSWRHELTFMESDWKLLKVSFMASTGFGEHLSVLTEDFVAQIWPKENSSNFREFYFEFAGCRNFYAFADFGGISTLCQTLWEGTN